MTVSQKGFSPIIVLVGIAAIVLLGGGLFYIGRMTTPQSPIQEVAPKVEIPKVLTNSEPESPSPSSADTIKTDETANWMIFKMEICGLSMKYPSGWNPKLINQPSANSQANPQYNYNCAYIYSPDYKIYPQSDVLDGVGYWDFQNA